MPDPADGSPNEPDQTAEALAALERMVDSNPETAPAESLGVLAPHVVPETAAWTPSAGPPPAGPDGRETSRALKRMAIPPMILMAGVMVALGLWAILALCGHNFMADEPNEAIDRLARIMLLCWPVGIVLIAGIVAFRRDN
jgi:hypothetical protein